MEREAAIMSELRIYEESGKPVATYHDFEDIRAQLEKIGVQFERWEASRHIDAHATQDEVIEAYRTSVNRLMNQYGFKSVDVINMQPDHPQREALRQKFLSEHTHDEFEVRFFVDGEALFCIRENGRVHGVLCCKGDLISVPAMMRHWFDMSAEPLFKCIRLFTTPEGWVANYTGDKIADRFPHLEEPHYHLPQAA
jgi:1,2-dihydroxy-3-keto-5-methylthiopentene dioxygenase